MSTEPTIRIIGRCAVSGCREIVAWDAPAQGATYRNAPRPSCGHGSTRFKRVRGVLDPSVSCNAACLNARSAECSCSCGGAHHGDNHVR